MRPFKTALKKLNAKKLKLLKNFTTLQNMRFLPQLNNIASALCNIFQASKAHNYSISTNCSFPVQQPSAGLSIGANCLTSCAKTYIHIQNKKDPLKNFNGPENIISKSAYLRLRNIIAMSAATPANAATSAGSGTCANPTCRLYPLPSDSTHLNTAYASSTPIP